MSRKKRILYDEYEKMMEELYSMVEKEQPLEEKFKSKSQNRYFRWKASEKGKSGKKWDKMTDEFSKSMTKKDWEKLPEKVSEIINPKMTKKSLIEHVNKFKSKKNLTKKEIINKLKNNE